MRRAVLLVALLVLSALVTPVAAQAGPFARAAPANPAGPFAQTAPSISPAGTTFVVQLQPDGDARWRVTTTYSLEDGNETTAFRRYARAYEDGDAVGGPNATFFRTAADRAEVVAGRNMTVENVTRDAGVANGTGRLTLAFVWTNFLTHGENRTLILGDALRTPDNGTWLRSLGPQQTLKVYTPPGYSITSTGEFQVTLRPNSFVVEGPRTFEGDGPLTVTYEPAAGPTTPPEPPLPLPAIAAIGVVLAVVLVSALAWQRRGGSAPSSTAGSGPDSGAGAATGGGDGDGSGAAAGAGEAATGGEGAAGDEAAEEPDLTLLSDEERVEHILERHGGRMRQADIVAETDWSDAKVSQLLSKMADEGRVEKLRLGRENLISLPDGNGDGNDE